MNCTKCVAIRRLLPMGVMIFLSICLLFFLITSNSNAIVASAPPEVRAATHNHSNVHSQLVLPLGLTSSADGTELKVRVNAAQELDGALFVNVSIGPGHQQGSYALAYAPAEETYTATVVGFAPIEPVSVSGTINITSTLGTASRTVSYIRYFAPSGSTHPLHSQDEMLAINFPHTDTLSFDTYITIVPTIGLPGTVPPGHRVLGQAYSVKAPDTVPSAERPMSVSMNYSSDDSLDLDPYTFSLLAWNNTTKLWEDLGGQISSGSVTATVTRFTTYVPMATTTWRSNAADLDSLDTEFSDNFTFSPVNERLVVVLNETPGTGSVVTQQIEPGNDFIRWGTLNYDAAAAPPATELAVDVLAADGITILLSDIENGADLEAIDPIDHPSLRLRARMTSTQEAATPTLSNWAVSWHAAETEQLQKLFLPIVQGNEP